MVIDRRSSMKQWQRWMRMTKRPPTPYSSREQSGCCEGCPEDRPPEPKPLAPRAPCVSLSGIWQPISTSSLWWPVELVGRVGWNKSMRCLFWLSLQGIGGNSLWHRLALQWAPDFGICRIVVCLPVLHLGTAPWPSPTWDPTLQPKWAHPDLTLGCLWLSLRWDLWKLTPGLFPLSMFAFYDKFGSRCPIPWTSNLVLFVLQLGLTSET